MPPRAPGVTEPRLGSAAAESSHELQLVTPWKALNVRFGGRGGAVNAPFLPLSLLAPDFVVCGKYAWPLVGPTASGTKTKINVERCRAPWIPLLERSYLLDCRDRISISSSTLSGGLRM